jgi:hypothetical protein
MRYVMTVLTVMLCSLLWAETLVTKAKIAEVTERGFVFTIGTEAVPAQDESGTRFWKGIKPAKKDEFKPGEMVSIRLKTDESPAVLREICDEPTADFLTKIRKETVACSVVKVEAKNLTVRFENGTEFTYRHSDKSKVTANGAAATMSDLKEGQKLYVKGRLLPTLDTWVVEATDVKPPVASATSKAKKSSKAKPFKLAPSGKLKGLVDLHQPQYWMVDIYIGEHLVHVIYNAKTQIKLEGAKADASAIERGLFAEVLYKRDIYGRPIASEIKLYHGER